MRRRIPPPSPFCLALGSLLALGAAGPALSQTLQERIDAASPGDTVLVAPGVYPRPLTVASAITLLGEGPGESRLGGLSGDQATLAGLVLDGSLGEPIMVQAGDGLVFLDCTFRDGIEAVRVAGGASVRFDQCRFVDMLRGVGFSETPGDLDFVSTTFTRCAEGVVGGVFPCPGGERHPAPPREDANRLGFLDCLWSGGGRAIDVSGPLRLDLKDCEQRGGSQGLRVVGGALTLAGDLLLDGAGTGTGLELRSAHAVLDAVVLSDWDTALLVGDGNCSVYSDVVVGGSLATGCDIGGLHTLILEQPEPIDAEYNFWGSTECTEVLANMMGQTVDIIVDAQRFRVIRCGNTPVEPWTWGRLRSAFHPGRAQ